jgi:site-specific DNA-methyltransferase (adenine-specific)
MKPYFNEGGITLYHGDCREVLPTLGHFDLLLTDPPYDIRAGNGGGVFGQRAHLVNTGGFTDGGCDYSFLDGFENWFCFCSLKQLPELLERASKMTRSNLITWCKPNPVPTCCNKYLPDVEYIVHGFSKGRLFGEFIDKSCFALVPCGNKETDHPNEKPPRIINRLVRLGSLVGESVIDPFTGSGTTGVACVQTGRSFVGIEIDETYIEIAAKRISRELAQGKLFEPEATAPAVQMSLVASM